MRLLAPMLCLLAGVSLAHCESNGPTVGFYADRTVGDKRDAGMDAAVRDPDEDLEPEADEPPCGAGYDYDGDGVNSDVERDAGLDPCQRDTDSDGCSDAFQYYLSGCDPRNGLKASCDWAFEEFDGQVRFRAPARESGNWARLMLHAERKGLQIQPVSASDKAVRGDANGFVDVPSGTELTFFVSLDEPRTTERVSVTLVDEGGQELDHGTVVFIYVECPILI